MLTKEEYCKKLCIAKSEDEVSQILLDMEQDYNIVFKPYGGTQGNYSSFENQQTTAEKSLMEKIVNSFDHMLIKQCKLKNIDPSSSAAPVTMEDARNSLFTKEELAQQQVWVITDGTKEEVNVIVADTGEGQCPEQFEGTLLSLQSGNKNNIPFVQGKFNMGSTGAVVFCGKNKYQLIISRKDRGIAGEVGKVGFTLVRKHRRTFDEQKTLKNTWYEYLTIDGEIPSFETEEIVLCTDFNNRYTFRDGTVIKLYNYQLSKKTQSFQALRYVINSLLYNPAFPVAVHESRRCFEQVEKRGGITNIAWGNSYILANDEKIEHKTEQCKLKGAIFGEAEISTYVYSSAADKGYLDNIRLRNPIVFLMNGQVQYHKSVSYISSELGYKLIKNHLFVVVDCTNLSKDFHDEGFFMANRETIRDTENNRSFLDSITKYLKEDIVLQRLNKERAAQQVSSSGTQELFERLLGKRKQDDFLKSMFKISDYGVKDKNSMASGKKEKALIEKKEFPSYVKMNGEQMNNSKNVSVSVGKSFSVVLEMDAVDDYFTRTNRAGTISVKIFTKGNHSGGNTPISNIDFGNRGTARWFDMIQSNLNDGVMKITFISKETEVEVGEEYHISITVSDEEKTFEKNVLALIRQKEESNTKATRNNGNSKLSLPPVILVYKNQAMIDSLNKSEEEKQTYKVWADVEEWEKDINKKVVKIIPSVDESEIASAIYINMSSDSLARIIQEEGTTGTKVEFSQEQFMTSIYANSFLILAAINSLKKKKNNNANILNEMESVEDFVAELIQEFAYAAVKMQINNVNMSKDLV